jgi:hypothetical protein
MRKPLQLLACAGLALGHRPGGDGALARGQRLCAPSSSKGTSVYCSCNCHSLMTVKRSRLRWTQRWSGGVRAGPLSVPHTSAAFNVGTLAGAFSAHLGAVLSALCCGGLPVRADPDPGALSTAGDKPASEHAVCRDDARGGRCDPAFCMAM